MRTKNKVDNFTVKMQGGPLVKFSWGGICGEEKIGGLVIDIKDTGVMVLTRKDCVKLGELMRDNIGQLEYGK